jgi:hypothetical protein
MNNDELREAIFETINGSKSLCHTECKGYINCSKVDKCPQVKQMMSLIESHNQEAAEKAAVGIASRVTLRDYALAGGREEEVKYIAFIYKQIIMKHLKGEGE